MGNLSEGGSSDLGPLSRGQSAISAGSRGPMSLYSGGGGGSDADINNEPPSDRFDEEDKEAQVLTSKGSKEQNKQDSLAIMKKYNIKTA